LNWVSSCLKGLGVKVSRTPASCRISSKIRGSSVGEKRVILSKNGRSSLLKDFFMVVAGKNNPFSSIILYSIDWDRLPAKPSRSTVL